VALVQALLDELDERGDVLFGGVGEQRLRTNVDLAVVGEAELVQDAQLIVVFEDGGGLAGRATQRLLLLYVVGKLAKRLQYGVSRVKRAVTCARTDSPFRRSAGFCLGAYREAMVVGVGVGVGYCVALRFAFVGFAVLI
jgi:hypothetical protein